METGRTLVGTKNIWINPSKNSFLGCVDPHQYAQAAKGLSAPKHILVREPSIFAIDKWDGDLSTRRFNIVTDGLTIECFGTPAKSKKLFVFLNAAGRKNANTAFHRSSWHPFFDGVCLNIEDPTYKAFLGKHAAGWYFGTKKVHALPVITRMINTVQSRYDIDNKAVYVIGSSSGGFAAMWLADTIPGATSLAGNPQFYATKWASAKNYGIFGIDLNAAEYYSRTHLDHIKLDGPSRQIVIINAQSQLDFDEQFPERLSRRQLPPIKYGLNTFQRLHIYCRSFNNKGAITAHTALDDARETRLFLDAMDSGDDLDTISARLNIVHEMQYTRFKAADKLFFVGLWAALLKDLQLPISLPQKPIESGNAKFPLMGSKGRIFYKVTWGLKGKKAFFTLHSQPKGNLPAVDLRKLGYTDVTIKNGIQSVSLGKFPKGRIRRNFIDVVNRTAPDLFIALGVLPPGETMAPLPAPQHDFIPTPVPPSAPNSKDYAQMVARLKARYATHWLPLFTSGRTITAVLALILISLGLYDAYV